MRFLLILTLVFAANSFGAEESVALQITSTTTSAVLGFGLGHVIKGTYLESGWKFTLLDASTVFLVLGAAGCDFDCNPAIPISVGLFVGVRIWEALDCLFSKENGTLTLLPATSSSPLSLVYSYQFK